MDDQAGHLTIQGDAVPESYGLPRIKKRARLSPAEQEKFAALVVAAYRDRNASIRALMHESGRSYGHIHKILAASPDVQLRGRGGAHHRPVSRKQHRT